MRILDDNIVILDLPAMKAEDIYGDCIEFDFSYGTLSINRYDGLTKITREEAGKLAVILTQYAEGKDAPTIV